MGCTSWKRKLRVRAAQRQCPGGSVQLIGVGLGSDLDPGISTCFPDHSGLSPTFRGPLTRVGNPTAGSDTGLPRQWVPWGRHAGALSPSLAVCPPPLPRPLWLAGLCCPLAATLVGPHDPTVYYLEAPTSAQPGILQTGSPNCQLSENQS